MKHVIWTNFFCSMMARQRFMLYIYGPYHAIMNYLSRKFNHPKFYLIFMDESKPVLKPDSLLRFFPGDAEIILWWIFGFCNLKIENARRVFRFMELSGQNLFKKKQLKRRSLHPQTKRGKHACDRSHCKRFAGHTHMMWMLNSIGIH